MTATFDINDLGFTEDMLDWLEGQQSEGESLGAVVLRMLNERKDQACALPLDAEVARVLGDFCSAAGVEVVDFLNQWVGSTVCDTFTLSRTRDGFLEGAAGDLLREWKVKEKDRPAVAAKMWEIIRRENAAKVKFTASAIAARRKAAATKGGLSS